MDKHHSPYKNVMGYSRGYNRIYIYIYMCVMFSYIYIYTYNHTTNSCDLGLSETGLYPQATAIVPGESLPFSAGPHRELRRATDEAEDRLRCHRQNDFMS